VGVPAEASAARSEVPQTASVRAKLKVMQEHGFYPASREELEHVESCGAHSPRLNESKRELATRPS